MANYDPDLTKMLRAAEERDALNVRRQKILNDKLNAQAAHIDDLKGSIESLRGSVSKAAKRIRYIEDIPGKRVPYFLNFSIDIPGPTDPNFTLAGSVLVDNKQISMDGPFVCTSYMSAFLMRTYSIGPYTIGDGGGRPNDPAAGTEVITPLSGRFRPVASTADPFSGAYIGAQVGPITIAGAQAVQTFRPGEIDYLFEIQDNGSNRNRQNQIPMPSRYIFSEFDRPLYLPVGDFFERGSTVTWKMTLMHDLGFAEVNYASLPNGFAEGDQTPAPDPAASGDVGRVPVAIGGTIYFTMCGYKILQAESPGGLIVARRRTSRRPKARRNGRKRESVTMREAFRDAQWYALFCVNSALGFYATRIIGNTLALAMPTYPALAKTLAATGTVAGTLWAADHGYIPIGANGDLLHPFVTGEVLAVVDAYTRGVPVLSGGG